MVSVYHGLDIVMLTSLNEGTPLSIIEAQFCGKPVIATNVGGVKDTFDNNVSGFLVNSHATAACITALEKLVSDPVLRAAMGIKGHIIAEERFSKQTELKLIDQLYTSCLNQNQHKQ